MIRLYSENLLIHDSADGALVSLDIGQLRQRLDEAFASCSLCETWIADNLIEVLRRRIVQCKDDGLVISTDDIDRCLQTVLTDTGFRDVALAFTWRHSPVHPLPADGGLSSLQPELLNCAACPPQLHFRPRYIRAEEWRCTPNAAVSAALSERLLRLLPVSDIIPIAVLSCDLARLIPADALPLFELEFAICGYRMTRAARALFSGMLRQMRRTWPEITRPGLHLRFINYRLLQQQTAPYLGGVRLAPFIDRLGADLNYGGTDLPAISFSLRE